VKFIKTSDAAKATAFALLQRFYVPQNGQPAYPGQDVARAKPHRLHDFDRAARCLIVPQINAGQYAYGVADAREV
jgi:ABC-type branched-subunit amino acid transport system ATPase component